MFGTVPPIPPPFGTSSGNPGSPNVNRVDTMPTTTDPINTMTTTNVSQSVVDENLPQLLDSRGGSHVTNVPNFDKHDFTSWKVRFLVFFDGFEPYLLKTLKDEPFVPMSSLSISDNHLPKRQNQWSNVESRLANQDKRLKSIIISCLPNDVMKYVIKCKTTKEMWNNLILARPSYTRDTKIAAPRLKFNDFKSLEGKKVNGTFTRLKCMLNDLENNGVTIPQNEVNATFVNNLPRKWLSMNQTQRANNSIKNDCLATLYGKYNYEEGLIDQIYESETQRFNIQASSSKALISNNHFQYNDSDVEEDQRTINEFMADLDDEYHERARLANQKRFYKRFGRVGSARKPIDRSKKTCFTCGKLEDEGTTKIRAFIATTEDEPSVRKTNARSSQWVDITLKKQYCQGPRRKRKEKISLKEVIFTMAGESSSVLAPKITSDSESDCETREPLPPLPKLIGVEPAGTSNSLISLANLTLNMDDLTLNTSVPKKTKPTSDKVSPAYVIKKKTENKSPAVPKSRTDRKADSSTEQLLLILMEEDYLKRVVYVNGLKHNLINISHLCDANFKVLFTKTHGTIFNQNDEVVLIAPRRKDVYIIDMLSYNKDSNTCFFVKASPSVNWLWHKRLSHLNFINNLAKHNFVFGLPSLAFSKDKNYYVCEKGKHHKASFKTKRSFSINKFLHLLHMDLFRPVKPQTISHNKYTLTIEDEYSRKMKNLNEVRVKKMRSDNGKEFRNHKLEEFYDENKYLRISHLLVPLNKIVSIIVKRHRKIAYDVFKGRSLDISYFHMFGCPVHIHNHKVHLGKFDEKADDGFFLGYSLVAKAFRVFNIRRQEMEETVHVTFSEDDEAISQSSTEGDAINFNENRSFSNDEFLEPRNPPEFAVADDHPAPNELDQPESADNLESAEIQDNITNKPISDDQPTSIFLPSAEGILQPPVPQDILSRVKDSEAASAHECLYVNFLSEMEPKKLIEALEEEGWIIAMQEELNQFERNKLWTSEVGKFPHTALRACFNPDKAFLRR
ncbi:retrovirus-related pol polyprotein from transposon TNT 1-94 [Tanacetum coccineum]